MCGVVGITDLNGTRTNDDMVTKFVLLLKENANRGQDAIGASIQFEDGEILTFKARSDHQLKNQISSFRKHTSKKILSIIGQTRYMTTGEDTLESAQPFTFEACGTQYSFVFNGTISNAEVIASDRNYYETYGLSKPLLDTSVLQCIITEFVESEGSDVSLQEIIEQINNLMMGACNIGIMSKGEIAISVDKNGVRPLPYSYSEEKGLFVFSSEQAPIDYVGETIKQNQSQLSGGEIFGINNTDGDHTIFKETMRIKDSIRNILCIADLAYLGRSDSLENYKLRKELGRRYAEQLEVMPEPETSLVIGVPNSAYYVAEGFSEVTGVPMNDQILYKYSKKRTFIVSIDGREAEIVSAYGIDEAIIQKIFESGQEITDIYLEDDTIVNGGTMRHIPSFIKSAYKKITGIEPRIHICIPMKSIGNGCKSGIEMNRLQLVMVQCCKNPYDPTSEELKNIAEMEFNAESLGYLDLDTVIEEVKRHRPGCDCCTGCTNGIDMVNYEKTLPDGSVIPIERVA